MTINDDKHIIINEIVRIKQMFFFAATFLLMNEVSVFF